jgi:O-antigen/teichoic acid export membrane protein
MEMPKNYFVLVITYALLIFLVTVIYLYFVKPIWYARIWGIGIGMFFALILCISTLKKINLSLPSIEKMQDLLSVGGFVIIHSFSMLFINQTDKLLIGGLLDSSQVGIFGVSAQFASSVTIIGSGISMAFGPLLYKSLAQEDYESYLKAIKIRNIAMLALLFISISIAVLIFFLSDLILGQEFPFNLEVFLILISAYLAFSYYFFFSSYFYYFKRTKLLSSLTFSIAILNILFSYLLIPMLGIIGAAIGTLVSYILGLFVAIIGSNIILKEFD